MAEVIFYEKPGCINNRKQKRLLQEAANCGRLLRRHTAVKPPRPIREHRRDAEGRGAYCDASASTRSRPRR